VCAVERAACVPFIPSRDSACDRAVMPHVVTSTGMPLRQHGENVRNGE